MDEKRVIEYQEIELRFEIILGLAMFLPTLLNTFFDAKGMEKSQLARLSLPWSALVAGYVLCYLTYAITKNKVPLWVNAITKWLLTAGIASFVFPTIVLATAFREDVFYWFNLISFKISEYCLPLLPVGILVFYVIYGVMRIYKKYAL